MCNGGGGGGGGNDFSYYENRQRDKENEAKIAAAQQAERDRLEKEQRHREYLTNLDAAATGAVAKGKKYFTDRGYGVNEDLINTIVNEAKARVPTDDSKPDSYFTNDIFDSGIAKEQDRQRTVYTGKVNQQFAPGFEKTLVSDTLDDDILNTILGEQSKSAMSQLQYNKDRGVINDVGYNEALGRFNGM